MITEINLNRENENLTWVDVIQPTDLELNSLAERFKLHKAALLDCLEPEHLPKHDTFGESSFVILRAFDSKSTGRETTAQQLSRKIAIFVLPDVIVTVHRLEIDFLAELRTRWQDPFAKKDLVARLFIDIIKGVIDSYEPLIQDMNHVLALIETRTFDIQHSQSLFDQGYYLRRRAHLCSHILRLTADIFESLGESLPEASLPYFNRMSQKCSRLNFYAEDIISNVDNLLSLHLAILAKQSNQSSSKINEVMRFLTVFSAFFLPLNFIASIYGMNFENMPELKSPNGYYFTLGLMGAIGTMVLWLFKRKGYLDNHHVP